jgi:hypothetical protein
MSGRWLTDDAVGNAEWGVRNSECGLGIAERHLSTCAKMNIDDLFVCLLMYQHLVCVAAPCISGWVGR